MMRKLKMTIAGLVLTGGIMAFNVMALNKGDIPSPQRPDLAYIHGDTWSPADNKGDTPAPVDNRGDGGIVSNASEGDGGGSPSYGHGDTPSPQA